MDVNINDKHMLTLCVTIPDSETRTSETNSAQGIFNNNVLGIENDNNTMRYILQIFDETGRPSNETLIEYSDGTTVTFSVRLVPGRDYTFVVWADFVTNGETNTDNHYITKDANGKTDLRNITINEDSWVAMDETRDAFTGIYSTKDAGEKYSSASTINVVLTRSFAKVRVVTTDLVALANLGIKPDYATVEYTTPYRAGFNALTCQPFEAEQNDKKTHQVSDSEAFAIVAYGDNTAANKVLFTDYLFASADQNDVIKFNLSVYENADKSGHIKTNSFTTDIAVKRNHLTTITGNILTDGSNVKVDINDDFHDEYKHPYNDKSIPDNYEIWYTSTDGKVVTLYDTNAFDANIVSNTYTNGKGIITFDGEISTIGDYAFRWCDITSVTIPNSVTSIGKNPFQNCRNLKRFNGELASHDGRCLIVSGVLNSFAPAGLTEYNIGNSVTAIGDDAFANCDELSNVMIGNSVIAIGDYAFAYCDNLLNVIIPDSVVTIGDSALFNCQKLTCVTIGNNVTNISTSAFAMCSKLKKFDGKFASNDGRSLIKDNVIIAYANASGFEYTIPDSVKLIGDYAFAYCTVTDVVIPESVTTICKFAFYNCYNLYTLYCKPVALPTISSDYVFSGVSSSCKIYVPMESVDAYKSADGWMDYADRIFGYNFNE